MSQLLDWAASELKSVSATPQLDAKVLFRHHAGCTDTALITAADQAVAESLVQSYKVLIGRRQAGMPVAYLTGTKEFWSLEFKVTADTLIPRPETELLVETALSLLDKHRPHRVLDLGTGSGAIAITIARERPMARVTATDNSAAALNIARENAKRLVASNLSLVKSDWFEQLPPRVFDLIVSNPPYIWSGDPHLDGDGIRFEPASALVSSRQGLGDLGRIINGAGRFLDANGWLLVEHGHDQSDQVRLLFRDAGYVNVNTLNDLNQTPRVSMAQSPHHATAVTATVR